MNCRIGWLNGMLGIILLDDEVSVKALTDDIDKQRHPFGPTDEANISHNSSRVCFN